jgi:hypothetical protein
LVGKLVILGSTFLRRHPNSRLNNNPRVTIRLDFKSLFFRSLHARVSLRHERFRLSEGSAFWDGKISNSASLRSPTSAEGAMR